MPYPIRATSSAFSFHNSSLYPSCVIVLLLPRVFRVSFGFLYQLWFGVVLYNDLIPARPFGKIYAFLFVGTFYKKNAHICPYGKYPRMEEREVVFRGLLSPVVCKLRRCQNKYIANSVLTSMIQTK